MQKILSILPRWIPALCMMLIIFVFSSLPGHELPNLLSWDYVVKKTSHAIGYALLALSYLHLLRYNKMGHGRAWVMALAYAVTDEFHQSFVPGRSASLFDVVIFDNIGVIAALLLHSRYSSKDETHTA